MFSAGDNGPFVGNIGNQHKLVPFILIIQLNTWMEIFSMEVGEGDLSFPKLFHDQVIENYIIN